MKLKNYLIIFLIVSLFYSCETRQTKQYDIEIEHFHHQISSNLRGLSVVDKNTVWASGANGTFLLTIDGGKTWKADSVAGAGMLDFRSIHAFDKKNAIVVSAGTPARIYKTSDGGNFWTVTFSSNDPAIFLDAVAFWDANHGLVMGDPFQGKLFLLKTNDGGVSWVKISADSIPAGMVSEGGFAASGTCMVAEGNDKAWIGVGGDSARVYRSTNVGESWNVYQTPILCGSEMRGIYSLSFKNGFHGIAVGGEWNVKNPPKSKAFTIDGGQTWKLGKGVDSYCSGSCFVRDDIFLACGQSGIDISTDGGRNWKNISDLHLYGIKFDETGSVGYGTGPGGRVVKLWLVE